MASFEGSAAIGYSLVLFGIVFLVLCYNFRSVLIALKGAVRKPLLKYLSYPPVVRSLRFKLQWSRAEFLAELAYLGFGIFCVCFKSHALESSGRRAANMCIGNLIFLYITPHLDALTNTLGIRWRTVRRLHGSFGIMAVLLLAFHMVASAFPKASFAMNVAENKWAVVAAASMGGSVFICIPAIRVRWYEMFLRLHQGLAIVSAYGIWVHVAPQRLLPRIHLYLLIGVASFSMLLLSVIVIRRNGMIWHKLPRADIIHEQGAVLIRVILSRPVHVKAGQYISLWLFVPTTSLFSFIQWHPFTVASWSADAVATLDLLIEPCAGLTQRLLRRSCARKDLCTALFSGPHGNSISVGDYEVVLMVASGYGIAAQLPYLKQLLHDYNRRSARARRIHLVWELKTLDLAIAIESLLNNALDDDTLDNGYILQISVYVEHVNLEKRISRRAEVIKGLPNWHSIVQNEVKGKLIKRVQDESSVLGSMVVTVSATTTVRQDLRAIVQSHVDDEVVLVELDYQPS